MTDVDVVVVGAGPTGLWLAAELGLAGVSTVVLERHPEVNPHAKAMGVHARTVETFAMRGVAESFLSEGRALPLWHFGMLQTRLDLRALDTPYPFMLAHAQDRTEQKLQQRALDLGVQIRRRHTVTGLRQDDETVTVDVVGPEGSNTLTARFVVGCDGAGSTVRRLSGIDYPGTDASVYGYLGDVTLDDPPTEPGFGYHGPNGALLVAPLPGGRFRVTGYDPVNQVAGGLTLEELREIAIRQVGTDFGMRDPSWLARFGNATRVAAQYRRGRVLLAGDAAHMHFPAGGVGLNLGVQDAMNLGWKLAAEVQGRARPGLLDSYHTERRPEGEAVAAHTLAQTALITAISPAGQELRALLSRTIGDQPAFSLALAEKLAATEIHYPATDPGAHALVGARVPGTAEFFGLLADGRPVLLNLSGAALPVASEEAARRGVVTHPSPLADSGRATWAGVGAVIVRPDGHVWWAGDAGPNLEAQLLDGLAGLSASF